MRLRRTFFPLVVIVFTAITSCKNSSILTEEEVIWLQENPNLKVSTYGYFPPYQFETEGKGEVEVVGFFLDYLNLIEEKIDYKFERVRYTDWSMLYSDALQGDLDLILEIQETPERQKHFNFFTKLFETTHIIVTSKANKGKVTAENLGEKRVIIPRDYSIQEILKGEYPDIRITNCLGDTDCLTLLNEGKYDAYIGPEAVVFYISQRNKLDNLWIGKALPYTYEPSIAVSKNNVILNSIIQKATASISDPELSVLYDHWLLKKKWIFYNESEFWISVFIFSLVLIVLITYNSIRLRSKVLRRTKDLNIALEAAESSSKMKTNFINNISHEIRTPLNGIIGFSELLQKSDKKELNDYLKIIIDSGRRLTDIVDNILDLSSIQSKAPVLNEKPTDLNLLLNRTKETFQSRADRRNISLESELNYNSEEQNPCIIIDEVKLNKIVNSLVDNALKFTNEGFIKINLNLSENSLTVIVEDTGVGIPENEKQSIYASFHQLIRPNSTSGLGLGLTIVKDYVLTMGGEIQIESEENKGTTFSIELPFHGYGRIDQTDAKKESESGSGTFQILIAEDDEINYLLIKDSIALINGMSIEVDRAVHGEEAVDLCKRKNFDLVVMDLRMPIMDGYEATLLIKKNYPELPILAYTAFPTEEKEMKDAGFDDYLIKPIKEEELRRKITKQLVTS